MNERIKQLAEQAGLNDAYMNFDHKYFAQLIVRECIDICQDTDGEEDAMALCGRQDCAVEIKQHFGVEE
jgi:hypothetical protein